MTAHEQLLSIADAADTVRPGALFPISVLFARQLVEDHAIALQDQAETLAALQAMIRQAYAAS